MPAMKVITGKVVGGSVQPEGVQDGTMVAVLTSNDAGFQLEPEQEAELSAALQEIKAGEFTPGADVIRELKGLRRR